MSVPLYQLRDYSGGGQPGLLTNPMGATDLSFNIAPATAQTWLNGSNANLGTAGPFVVALDAGTATIEKILCSAVTPSTGLVTVWSSGGSNGRGYDGTAAQGHVAGTTINAGAGVVILAWSAREAYEANELVSQVLGAATEIGQVPTVSSLSPPALTMAAGAESVQHSAAITVNDSSLVVAGGVSGPMYFKSLSSGALGGPGAPYGWDTTNQWYMPPTSGCYAALGKIGISLVDSGNVNTSWYAGADVISVNNNGGLAYAAGGVWSIEHPVMFYLSQGTQVTWQIENMTSGDCTINANSAYSSIFFAFQGPT